MKLRVLPILLIYIFSLSVFAKNQVFYSSAPNSLEYDAKSDEYILKLGQEVKRYPRFRFRQMLSENLEKIPAEDREQLSKMVGEHATVQMLNNPTAEEVLAAGLRIQDQALAIVEHPTDPCFEQQQKQTNSEGTLTLSYEAPPETLAKHNEGLKDMAMADQGFFKLGELTGYKLTSLSGNDNPLHGLTQALGLTQYGKGIDGDDRGKTFALNLGYTEEYENGSYTVRTYSDLYGRFAPQSYMLEGPNGKKYGPYTSRKDEQGRYYLEALVVEGVELELIRNYDDTYVKVIGRTKTIDDKGAGTDIQAAWHEAFNAIEYNYVDHLKKRDGVELYLEVGKKYELVSTDNVRLTTTASTGVNLSTLGDQEIFMQARGDIKLEVLDNAGPNRKFASWEVNAYVQAKKYADSADATHKGVEITKRFSVNENNYVVVGMGMHQEDDRWSREYGADEMNRNGRLDFQHTFLIGYEHKF